MSTINSKLPHDDIKKLCDGIRKYNYINPADFDNFNVKRGLRNADGTGVMAGITKVCSVEGYYIDDGEKVPREGRLKFRGIDMESIVNACIEEDRFGFEEVVYLLIFGELPNSSQLEDFKSLLFSYRPLPISRCTASASTATRSLSVGGFGNIRATPTISARSSCGGASPLRSSLLRPTPGIWQQVRLPTPCFSSSSVSPWQTNGSRKRRASRNTRHKRECSGPSKNKKGVAHEKR